MFSSEPYHPPMRITDLLNPVPLSSSSDVLSPSSRLPPAHESEYHSTAHGQRLPEFAATSAKHGAQERGSHSPPSSAGSSRVRMYGADQFARDSRDGGSWARVQARESSYARANSISGGTQEQVEAYSLRAASWESARALTMTDSSVQGQDDRNADLAVSAPLSNLGEYIKGGTRPASSSPRAASSETRGSIQVVTSFDSMQSRVLPPISPYATSQSTSAPGGVPSPRDHDGHYNSRGYTKHTTFVGTQTCHELPHIVSHGHPMSLVRALPGHESTSPELPKIDDGASNMDDITPSYQLGDRASTLPDRRSHGYSAPPSSQTFQLQSGDTQHYDRQIRKRTFSEADGRARSGSTSSARSLQVLSPGNAMTVQPSAEYWDACNAAATQSMDCGKSSKSASPAMSSDTSSKRRKSTLDRNNSEERRAGGSSGPNASESAKDLSSQKGTEKVNGNYGYPYVYAPGQAVSTESKLTPPYGVNVVPVNSSMPFMQFNPYSMHPMPPGVPVPVQGQHSGRIFPELQYARCMSARYRSDAFPRCVSCTRRWAGDTCRFQNIRTLLRDENKNLVAVGFQTLTSKSEGTEMIFPDKWNVELQKRHVDRIMATVATALLPHLMKEVAHQKLGNVVKRQRETDVRATCDTCMTSLFSSSWMCRQCGREACEECYQTICRLTADPSPAAANGKTRSTGTGQRSMRERHAAANPFFLSCNRKAEHGVFTFNPVTRFEQGELEDAVKEMQRLVDKSAAEVNDGTPDMMERDGGRMNLDCHQKERLSMKANGPQSPSLPINSPSNTMSAHTSQGSGNVDSDTNKAFGAGSLTPDVYNDGVCTLLKNPVPPSEVSPGTVHVPPSCLDDISPPTWPVPYYSSGALTEPVFAAQWARGTPLVVTGLLDRFQLHWTPQYFINSYGSQACIVLECQTEANKKVTVAEFFSCFGDYTDRKEIWKLKDWPPSTDFRTAFPELYDDFSRAVPIPNYTRRDGTMNIASHFPTNTIAPDLGPKMYNAYASTENAGTKGSTRLHMDMADAVNIMMHAELTPDGVPGCAVWDIFRAEDAIHLRAFFKRHFKGQYQNDPIHAQTFYLDTPLRAQLFAETGVRPFRIYQRPGEAVFIPAGCAHQVCNLADCVKVACDFVSPENVERCETLTREFRAQNQSLVWKEDVLQLRSMMWFAWQSCRRQQVKWRGTRKDDREESVSNGNENVARTLATATDIAING